ncbi:MAG: PcfB family protein [Lachnospiraceae bacterium]|nr:PcfB family protein [Lachnospiraceae bacterium]
MGSEAQEAEFVVRFALQGMSYVIRLAGEGAMNAAAMIKSIIDSPDNSPGKKTLNAMLKSKEVIRPFSISEDKFDDFVKEAKRYGIQYCIAKRDKKDANYKDGIYDILVKDSDAPRLNRIIEKLGLGTVAMGDTVIDTDVKDKSGAVELSEAQKIMEDMFSPNMQELKAEEMEKEGFGDTGVMEPSEQHQSEGSFKSTDNRESVKDALEANKVEAESVIDVFANARNIRVNMMSEDPELADVDIPGWKMPDRGYNENGEPLYRGKTTDEFTERDKMQFMVDNEMINQGRLPEVFVNDLFKRGFMVNEDGIVEELETSLTTRERQLIADMMQESKELGNDLNKIKEVVNNVRQ